MIQLTLYFVDLLQLSGKINRQCLLLAFLAFIRLSEPEKEGYAFLLPFYNEMFLSQGFYFFSDSVDFFFSEPLHGL